MKKLILALAIACTFALSAHGQNVTVVNNTTTVKPGTATYAKVVKSGPGSLASFTVFNPTTGGFLVIYEGTSIPASSGGTAVSTTMLVPPTRLLINSTINFTFPIPIKFATGCVITWSATSGVAGTIDTTGNPNDMLIGAQVN